MTLHCSASIWVVPRSYAGNFVPEDDCVVSFFDSFVPNEYSQSKSGMSFFAALRISLAIQRFFAALRMTGQDRSWLAMFIRARRERFTWEIRRERILYSSWSGYTLRRKRRWSRPATASKSRHGIASTWDAKGSLPPFCAILAAWHRRNALWSAKSPTTLRLHWKQSYRRARRLLPRLT